MTRSEQIFLLVILINTLISIVYLLWGILAHKKNEEGENGRLVYVIRAICMFICPVVGIMFFLIGHIFKVIFFNEAVDLDDVIFSKERVRQISKANEEREMNLVPIQEALAVSEQSSLRQLMLDVLKGDIDKSLASIALALNSKDSETSHYAASVLSKELNEFRINARRLEQQMDESEDDVHEYARMLIVYLDKVLKQRVFTSVEQEHFIGVMERAGEKLYELEKFRALDGSHNSYAAIAGRIMDEREFERAKKWCDRALKVYPGDYASYQSKLKYLFATEQKDEFRVLLDELKVSGIEIDSETLEMIRVFN